MNDMFEAAAAFLDAPDPVDALEKALDETTSEVAERLAGADPIRLIEVARVACLPWSFPGASTPSDVEAAPALAELLALVALTSGELDDDPRDDASAGPRPAWARAERAPRANDTATGQPLTDQVQNALPFLQKLLHLSQIRSMVSIDPQDGFARIAAMVQSAELWVRNSSYPDAVEESLRELFDEPSVVTTLVESLGFNATQAIATLEACHSLQVESLNRRMHTMFDKMEKEYRASSGGRPDPKTVARLREDWLSAWEPTVEMATVSAGDIGARVGISEETVVAVMKHFSFQPDGLQPRIAVERFTEGSSPLRIRPVIAAPNGRFLLIHNGLVPTAVRESLESALKSTAVWEVFQSNRGRLLERRTHDALARALPDAIYRDGFQYFVPADDAEAASSVPGKYTKRVEGDHLVIQDDVAIIVEDKAVAMAASSRAGNSKRLRKDLVGIVTRAAEQAGRLQDCIERDRGLRIHGEGWLDLSHIREIHTIAVSLDDLPYISTATAELVKAQFLDSGHIPWTVSIHDLDLITDLIGRPAEFLLYLQRRRDPEATVYYTAPDELDLFLYFFEAGLYVEPDPDEARKVLPFLPPPTTAERRRRRGQVPALITSRTDELDNWHYSVSGSADQSANRDGLSGKQPKEETSAGPSIFAPKPKMTPSPLTSLIDAIYSDKQYGRLSIGAMLLSGSSEFQSKLARIPRQLLENPRSDGRERTVTIPLGTNRENAWLLVWATRPIGRDARDFEADMRDYLRTKKHQLGLRRGVILAFDQATKVLAGVYYDGHEGPLEPRLEARLSELKPIEAMQGWAPPSPPKSRAGSGRRNTRGNKSRRARKGRR
ncbi:hypothetical protein [Cellulomonas humilata]|nr:hypothetical protein [Cellulomonas humilata]